MGQCFSCLQGEAFLLTSHHHRFLKNTEIMLGKRIIHFSPKPCKSVFRNINQGKMRRLVKIHGLGDSEKNWNLRTLDMKWTYTELISLQSTFRRSKWAKPLLIEFCLESDYCFLVLLRITQHALILQLYKFMCYQTIKPFGEKTAKSWKYSTCASINKGQKNFLVPSHDKI